MSKRDQSDVSLEEQRITLSSKITTEQHLLCLCHHILFDVIFSLSTHLSHCCVIYQWCVFTFFIYLFSSCTFRAAEAASSGTLGVMSADEMIDASLHDVIWPHVCKTLWFEGALPLFIRPSAAVCVDHLHSERTHSAQSTRAVCLYHGLNKKWRFKGENNCTFVDFSHELLRVFLTSPPVAAYV